MSDFSYYCYDLLTGTFVGAIPLRGVSFGQTLNTAGQLTGTLDLRDPRMVNTNAIGCTIPNRTFLIADYQGAAVWGGIVQTRRWTVNSADSSTQAALTIQCSELWSYFQQRVQATDYSAPPFSGINPSGGGMPLWTATPWDPSLIACQIISDAIGHADTASIPYADLLGGLGLLLNGATPASPVTPSGDYIAINYPFTSTQTVDSIVQQLSQLGVGVGFDFGVDVAYSAGAGSTPIATINLSYPRRGRTVAQNMQMIDLTTARTYEFPEDGTQTANQVYETGGSGAIEVSVNPFPLTQGYPLFERVMSRANAQSQNLTNLLTQLGTSDLAIYSYAPVAPSVTLGAFDQNCPIGSFTVGDDVQVNLPANADDGTVFDARFPAGLSQEWRIVAWQASIGDQGDSTIQLTLNLPPFVTAVAPAVN